MDVIISTVSNPDLAQRAVRRLGGTPHFLCLQSARPMATQCPVSFFDDANAYRTALRRFVEEHGSHSIYFSTAASDAMQQSDAGFRSMVTQLGCRFVGQSDEAVAISSNKRMSRELASDVGMDVPKEAIKAGEALAGRYYVVKRLYGDWGNGQKIVSGETHFGPTGTC